jgi:hypothetical protein
MNQELLFEASEEQLSWQTVNLLMLGLNTVVFYSDKKKLVDRLSSRLVSKSVNLSLMSNPLSDQNQRKKMMQTWIPQSVMVNTIRRGVYEGFWFGAAVNTSYVSSYNSGFKVFFIKYQIIGK